MDRYLFQHLMIDVESTGVDYAPFVRRILNLHGLDAHAVDDSAPRWSIEIESGNPTSHFPADLRLVARHFAGISFHETEDAMWLRRGADAARIAASENSIRLWLPSISEATEQERMRVLYLFLTFCLLLLLQREQLFALHAAGLAREPQRGVLLIGPSNSGKSTLTMHLVERGWSYLSDDSVVLIRREDRVEMAPLRTEFLLDPDVAAKYPRLRKKHAPSLADPGKYAVAIQDVYPQQFLSRVEVETLIFPRIVDASESRILPLSAASALRMLMPQTSFLPASRTLAAKQLETLRHLVLSVSSFQLLAGRDIKESSAAAVDLLDPLVMR